MDTISITEARTNLYQLVDSVNSSSQPTIIAGKRGNAVLIGEDDWRAMQETLHLLSVPGMRESLLEASREPLEKATKLNELDW